MLLYGITKATPPNYDFPLTRAALKGHTEYHDVSFAITEENGRRFLGAFVRTLDQGQALSRLIRKHVKGALPAVLCANPEIVRPFDIDLESGQLIVESP